MRFLIHGLSGIFWDVLARILALPLPSNEALVQTPQHIEPSEGNEGDKVFSVQGIGLF